MPTTAPAGFDRTFAIATGLNARIVALELVYGYLANSMALVADAAHNASDILALLLAWGAFRLATRPPSADAPTASAAPPSSPRSSTPRSCSWPSAASASRRSAASGPARRSRADGRLGRARRDRHQQRDRAALRARPRARPQHRGRVPAHGDRRCGLGRRRRRRAADRLDGMELARPRHEPRRSSPSSSWGTWRLLTETVNLALHAVPSNVDRAAVERYLAGLPGVVEVHDLHIWALSTTQNALTAHLVGPGTGLDDGTAGRRRRASSRPTTTSPTRRCRSSAATSPATARWPLARHGAP